MHRRLLIIGILALCEVLWLLVSAVSATESTDYEAYIAAKGQTVAGIAEEYGIAADYLAQVNHLGAQTPLDAGQVIIIPNNPEPAVSNPDQASDGEATSPNGNLIHGKLGVIVADKAQILAQPGQGKVLFSNAARGTELLVIGQSGDYFGLLMADGSTGFVLKKFVGLTEREMDVTPPTPPPPPTPKIEQQPPVVATAFQYMGIPYRYGGRLPKNVDCSLLVQTAFGRNGIRLPRTAAQQMDVGQPVAVQDLQSGDRLYFYNRAGSKIGHTALYIGNGEFIHASANRGRVAVDSISNPTYWTIYAGARR